MSMYYFELPPHPASLARKAFEAARDVLEHRDVPISAIPGCKAIDQDWENEATTWIFKDGTSLRCTAGDWTIVEASK